MIKEINYFKNKIKKVNQIKKSNYFPELPPYMSGYGGFAP